LSASENPFCAAPGSQRAELFFYKNIPVSFDFITT
jgi:hypothetical protein